MEVVAPVVQTVQSFDTVNTELIAIQESEENILEDGTNLVDYSYGDTATFIDENGEEVEVKACLPTVQSVTFKGEMTIIFPRDIEPITEEIVF